MKNCKTTACGVLFPKSQPRLFCNRCSEAIALAHQMGFEVHQGHSMPDNEDPNAELARLYPKYHKALPEHWKTVDVYRVHSLFPVVDPSGRLVHSSKKLLLSGVRTGGKSQYDDVREARDTLNGWLADNAPTTTPQV